MQTMINVSRKLLVLSNFNLIFGLAFLIHIISIWYNSLHPENPSVKIYKMNLRDIEFPITLDLCLQEIYKNKKKFNNVGYAQKIAYFKGESWYGKNIYGWSGHTKNGSTLSSVQGKHSYLDLIVNSNFPRF